MEAELKARPGTFTTTLYVVFLGLALFLIVLLFPHLVSRYYYQQGLESFNEGQLSVAWNLTAKAEGWLPAISFANDRKRIKVVQGDILLRRGKTSETITGFVEDMEAAEKSFRHSVNLSPLDVDANTGLAMATASLENIYPFIKKRPFATRALPIYQHLLTLMPVNLYTRELMTKYFYSRNMPEKLNAIIAESISLYPPLYSQLKRQPFYTTTMDQLIQRSLINAVENGVYVEAAYKALSDLAYRVADYAHAIDYFKRSIPVSVAKESSTPHLQLGRLYLKNNQAVDAESSFLKAVEIGDRKKIVQDVWNIYRAEKYPELFLAFVDKVVKKYKTSEYIEIIKAKCLIEMGRLELARAHLIRISTASYLPESLYLQARIAELQKDWDTMELRSQRATVLKSGNPVYYQQFARSLQKQKKWPQAENAVTNAIIHATKKNPWLYNQRAWIRWSRNDLSGALEDWQQAVSISPKNSGFYYNMALLYNRAGNKESALSQVNQALKLKPKDERVLKLKEKLLGDDK